MPFTLNLDPVLFSFGPLEIRYYGLVYVLGFLLAYFVLMHYSRKLRISKDDVENYLVWLIIGVILGSRLFHVLFWQPSYFLNHPWEIFMIWKGGMAFHGGLIAVVVVSYLFAKKKKVHLAKLADILTIPAVLVLALGRIANFINGELWGTVTNVPWCVNFKGAEGCRHPTQIYGALKRFFIFGMLLFLNRKKYKDGFLFWVFVGLMGLGRFFINFVRVDGRFLGLSVGQCFSLLMVFVAVYVLMKYYKNEFFT